MGNDLELQRQWISQLETLGIENVRIHLANNTYIPKIDREFAWRWLRQQDETRQSRDRRNAQWTLVASIIAAVAGIVAAVASVLALRW
jgi:hypothetical protein